MWELVLTLVLSPIDPNADATFRQVRVPYATEQQCVAARDWWIAHEFAEPRGWDARWMTQGWQCRQRALPVQHSCRLTRAPAGESSWAPWIDIRDRRCDGRSSLPP